MTDTVDIRSYLAEKTQKITSFRIGQAVLHTNPYTKEQRTLRVYDIDNVRRLVMCRDEDNQEFGITPEQLQPDL